MSKVFLFPGQGSQAKGMGADCFELFPELVELADDILGYSIVDLCVDDAEANLDKTQYTQPALYIVNALMYLQRLQDGNELVPDFAAGHSLGEYNALFAAGAFDFATGLKLVQRRGQIMSRVEGGGMAAVIGMTVDEIRQVLADSGCDGIDIANFNAPTQTVISGPKADIEAAQTAFESAGARMYVVLKVSGAFHSRYMKDPAAEFAEFIDSFSFQPLKFPVIANHTGEAYGAGDIHEQLIMQISNSVRWTDSIQYLMDQPAVEFEEVGPGKILTSLIRQIQRGR
jgi:trans-AT polyketide synthase/acyltransferase/oxidoreductase domain-containing protein